MKRFSRILWGVFLVALGAVWTLNALNVTAINVFFDGWWTLFIIIPSLVSLFTEREKVWSIICLLAGVLLLLAAQNVITYDMLWKLILPVAVILVGLSLIFKTTFDRKVIAGIREADAQGGVKRSCTAAFSGQKLDCAGQTFEGAELTAVFGGIDCDLRGAIIPHDAVIDLSCVFGGVDVFLPPTVNVQCSTTSIFGGVSQKQHQNLDTNTVTVYIRGTCVFGGAEVK